MGIKVEELTKEDIEDILQTYDILGQLVGFQNGEEMENFKVDASLGMIKFGGSFASALGHALAHADLTNTAKIIRSFRECCNDHASLYRKWLAKREQEDEV